jgi:thermitase
VVSTYEDAEVRDVTARTLHNANDCRAVTYFVRQVYEAYEVSTRVVDILWRYPDRVKDPGRGIDDWRSVRHMEDVEPEIREAVEKALRRLPRLGEIFKEPRRLTVPTDGTIYQSELSHCSSCEPQREAAALLSLERANAETRKACLEVQLLELEIQRRKRLLESGDLTPFLTDAPKASS